MQRRQPAPRCWIARGDSACCVLIALAAVKRRKPCGFNQSQDVVLPTGPPPDWVAASAGGALSRDDRPQTLIWTVTRRKTSPSKDWTRQNFLRMTLPCSSISKNTDMRSSRVPLTRRQSSGPTTISGTSTKASGMKMVNASKSSAQIRARGGVIFCHTPQRASSRAAASDR